MQNITDKLHYAYKVLTQNLRKGIGTYYATGSPLLVVMPSIYLINIIKSYILYS